MREFNLINCKEICYELADFKPLHIDGDFLKTKEIDYNISDEISKQLSEGSEWYKSLLNTRQLMPENNYIEISTDVNEELEIHNYTGICPTNVLEVSPSSGSCAVACQYCLVTDGKHIKRINLYSNYPVKVANSLKKNKDRALYYYFSPKTEAFSEPHLYSGIAHQILREFIKHYNEYPDSKVRIFIATKAGPAHLEIKHEGESVLDLMEKMSSKIQLNGSIGIMPQYLRNILEPNAASISERLEALAMCRDIGVFSESVLCQPLIIPYLTHDTIYDYIRQLSEAGVKNIKPEFFTAEIRNLVLVAQYINHYDPDKVKDFFYPYLMDHNQQHIKQRSRLAPDRAVCVSKLSEIRDIAEENGIHISICNWVKKELSSVADWVKTIDKESAGNGYRCLGYQTKLFNS